MPTKKTVEETYEKFEHIEHIIKRPDSYVGSIQTITDMLWTLNEDKTKMEQQQVKYVPGLYKIFDEILVNAIDQSVLDGSLDVIKISYSVEDGSITVHNTGKGIPIVKHSKFGIYVPELIFANLLSSSNYNDSEQRKTGGRNGYGAKLANVFSTKFIMEIGDPENGKKYVQVCENNMSVIHPPKVTSYSKGGYVKITFHPDFDKFGMKGFDSDFVKLIEKRAYEASVCTSPTVKVSLNGKAVPVKTFEKFADLFIGGKKDSKRVFESPNENWDVCVAPSSVGYKHVSFVNGICTNQGGSHLEYVSNQIIRKLIENVEAKKKIKIKPQFIKEHMFIMVRSTLINPTFSSQTKDECTSRYNTFGSSCQLSDKFFKELMKTDIVEEAVGLAQYKEKRELSKTDGKKSTTIKGIPKLEDANRAGSAESSKCTLCLTEGDSAKALVLAGISKLNRNYWGVFPLKGKLLNVRDASMKQLLDNEEIKNIKSILGLQQDKKYKDVSSLRYGRVMICTDADTDGFHIRGLVINFIGHFWPELLESNFICSLVTPVVKATKGKNVLQFFNMVDYENFMKKKESSGYKTKYHKGLGTSTAAEGAEYFQNIDKYSFKYVHDEKSAESISLGFDKKLADKRKEWLSAMSTDTIQTFDVKTNEVSYTEFINNELILFSMADNQRSIPSVADGLKPSQRKVLFGCFKRKLKEECKVAQLSGYISEHTAYHHGEASLHGTIINMAQDYTGSNNINLLYPGGQFGTRMEYGKDSASPRYIFTRLMKHTRTLFPEKDDAVLSYLVDDNQSIEPKYYYPVLPMILINGTDGIGTGWNSKVPCFNPEDVKRNVMNMIYGLPLSEMKPWYKGFKGTVTKVDGKAGTFKTTGKWEIVSHDTLMITDIPIGKSTNSYKQFLEELRDESTPKKKRCYIVKSVDNHSSDVDVKFIVKCQKDAFHMDTLPDIIESEFKLTSLVNTNNMNLFDGKGYIKHYESPQEIMKDWYDLRFKCYTKRRAYELKRLDEDISRKSEEMRFIELIMNDQIKVFRVPKKQIEEQCEKHSFKKKENSFKYLTDMPISKFSQDEIDKLGSLIRELKKAHTDLTNSSETDLWKTDIEAL